MGRPAEAGTGGEDRACAERMNENVNALMSSDGNGDSDASCDVSSETARFASLGKSIYE